MQDDLFSALEKGHAAAQASAERADREIDDWTLKAVALIAESHGLPSPPDGRAWGHIAKRCQRDGTIISAGFGAAKSSNGSPKVLWKRK
jgi:hypothetical protein